MKNGCSPSPRPSKLPAELQIRSLSSRKTFAATRRKCKNCNGWPKNACGAKWRIFRKSTKREAVGDGLRQEHLWREQEKNNKELLDHLPPILHDLRVHEEMLRLLWKLQEQYGGRYISAAQLWLDGLQTALEERDDTMKGPGRGMAEAAPHRRTLRPTKQQHAAHGRNRLW